VKRSIVAALVVAGGLAPALGVQLGAQQGGGGGGQAPREHRMTGCLQKVTEAGSFLVTDVEGKGPKTVGIVSSTLGNIPGFVGRKVEVTGIAIPVAEAEKMDKKPPKAEHYMNITAIRLISLNVRGPLVPDEVKCP
jgi:hypothetical protein